MMQVFKQREVDVIDPGTEMHYALSSSFEGTKFPHSHDFFEFSLILEGTQCLEVTGHTLTLEKGGLVLIRPNEVHSRSYLHPGQHINVAFSTQIARAMFAYLGEGYPSRQLLEGEIPPYVLLSDGERVTVQRQLNQLNAVQLSDPARQRTLLRTIIIEIFVHYFFRWSDSVAQKPHWLDDILREMQQPEQMAKGVEALVQLSGCSHEHLCRIFRQQLQCTPTQYVNELRLNYAANCLLHSNRDIVDISMEVGFDNLSHFYHMFGKKFGMAPGQFRRSHQEEASRNFWE